jgi:hypothetical protein
MVSGIIPRNDALLSEDATTALAATNDHLSIHYAVRVMRATLGEPAGIPPGYPDIILRREMVVNWQSYPWVLFYYRDLFISWIAWLAAPRTLEQRHAVYTTMETCRCAEGPDEVHTAPASLHRQPYGVKFKKRTATGIIGRLCETLNNFIGDQLEDVRPSIY